MDSERGGGLISAFILLELLDSMSTGLALDWLLMIFLKEARDEEESL